MRNSLCSLLLFFITATCFAQNKSKPGRQQFAAIGDFKLESGNTINNCKIGYRTYGQLNSAKSNVILFLTWFGGTARDVEGTAPWQAVDTTHYFLVIVDALGDGVSASPSNSVKQHGPAFPAFSIRDIVESQHQLLTNKLGFAHVHAIMGISMGGIQTFQWAVSYPDFTDVLIPIVGSPQPTSYDLMLYSTYRKIIEADSAFNHGNYKVNPIIPTANMLWELFLTTPANRVKGISHDNFPKWLTSAETKKTGDWNDSRDQMDGELEEAGRINNKRP